MSLCGEYLGQALAVGPINENFDPSVPPSTGEEYIHRVMLEASKCEDVIVADVDRSNFKTQTFNIKLHRPDTPVKSVFKIASDWQQCQVADFAEVRQKLARQRISGLKTSFPLPLAGDKAGWYSLCFGNNNNNNAEPVESVTSDEGSPPLLTIMLSMHQHLIEQVLEYQVEWLETKSSLSNQQGKWLYALLACLELPLAPETCSLLRSLARECSRIRSLKSTDDPSIAPLTLLICLVANYFRQMDLADKTVTF